MLASNNILKKITSAGLVGRGGASYPTAAKWAAVKAALKGQASGYIVINGAEGEPGVKKDGYILEYYPEEVVNGVYLAEQFLGAAKIKKIYFFLSREYYKASADRTEKSWPAVNIAPWPPNGSSSSNRNARSISAGKRPPS